MTQVDFYLLEKVHDRNGALQFACRLADKAWRGSSDLLIAAASAEECATLGELLWSQQPSSFLPHDDNVQDLSTLSLCTSDNPGEHSGCLINTSGQLLPYCARFQRVCEIVIFEESARETSRKHYKYYKDRGFPIKTHTIA